jgi:hypothetical protein
LVGSIYGRSFIKIANFVLIREQTWPPQAIFVFDWLISKKIFSSETADQDEMSTLYRRPSIDASYHVSIH